MSTARIEIYTRRRCPRCTFARQVLERCGLDFTEHALEAGPEVRVMMRVRTGRTGARWALAGWDAVDEASAANQLLNIRKLSDVWGRPVLLFPSEWRLNTVAAELGDELKLRPHALAPDVEVRRRKK